MTAVQTFAVYACSLLYWIADAVTPGLNIAYVVAALLIVVFVKPPRQKCEPTQAL